MERISVFDIFKIGVGPSSSHTMGPWKATQHFIKKIIDTSSLSNIHALNIHLFGSLAKTGKGHGTDIAVMLGLSGYDPVTIPVDQINSIIEQIKSKHSILLGGKTRINFNPLQNIQFHFNKSLPFHPNALSFEAILKDGKEFRETYFSIGGGFVIQEGEEPGGKEMISLKFPIEKASDLLNHCKNQNTSISNIVLENEKSWRSREETNAGILKIWNVMLECIFRGSHTEGVLPGNLNVQRRAAALNKNLLGGKIYSSSGDWIKDIKSQPANFQEIIKWVSSFALAVNEENASFGRVVTAPTNGAAGVIPAVLLYFLCFCENKGDEDIIRFLCTASEIGSIFKKGSTISAAMGGCQAEIGVSSAMAAAGLTEVMNGTPEQAFMAAEIAMEHHLGMTCDPIGGLVQIPCIERNTMGAIKAITASQLALSGDPANAKVSLDGVIKTMWETAKDMNEKYKETSDGGLAINISVNLPEC